MNIENHKFTSYKNSLPIQINSINLQYAFDRTEAFSHGLSIFVSIIRRSVV